MNVTRRPTMRDVANLAGVGVKTVSRVINNEPNVSSAVTERVRIAIASLRYEPDERAGNLRRGARKTDTIGLIVSSVANPFAGAVHRAIEDAATARGVAVLASSLDDDPSREQRTVSALLRRRVDGLIMTTASSSQGYLLTEQAYGTPLVFVDREPVGITADAIISDNAGGAMTATRHLIDGGHRSIAYLGYLHDLQSASERRRGFFEELGRAGISTLGLPIAEDLHDEDAAQAAALAILDGPDRPTAIFSAQNQVTVGVIRALRQRGLEHEVAVVGFDDFPLADLLEPGVTVIAQNPDRIGQLAADHLFARLDGQDVPARTTVVPTRLIVRGSGELAPRG